jgi:hypothetical protein
MHLELHSFSHRSGGMPLVLVTVAVRPCRGICSLRCVSSPVVLTLKWWCVTGVGVGDRLCCRSTCLIENNDLVI